MVPLESLGVRTLGSGYTLDRGKSNNTLPHELIHQLTPPPYFRHGSVGWFIEGIAEYGGTHDADPENTTEAYVAATAVLSAPPPGAEAQGHASPIQTVAAEPDSPAAGAFRAAARR